MMTRIGWYIVIASFGFLLASFPASKSEIWGHLAQGKALLQGQVDSVETPQLHSSQSEYVGRLYCLLLFLSYQAVGSTGLVILKALVVALLGMLIFAVITREHVTLRASGLVILALLAMTPWMELQPELLSLLFFACTLASVKKLADLSESDSTTIRTFWRIPAIILLWANVDSLVILGPVTIALCAAGELWWRRPKAFQLLLQLVPLTLLATLCTPSHIQLWLNPSILQEPSETVGLPSILDYEQWIRSGQVAVLVSVTLFSFMGLWLILKKWPAPSGIFLFAWFFFLGLSIWRTEFIPFFALISCVTVSLGLTVNHSQKQAMLSSVSFRLLRWLSLTLGVFTLMLGAWTGWLQGQPYGHRLWDIRVDTSLREAVVKVQQVQEQRSSQQQLRGLTFSRAFVDYASWFATTENNSIEPMTKPTEEEWSTLRERLGLQARPVSVREFTVKNLFWRAVLRKHKIDYLVFHQGVLPRTTKALWRLTANPQEWELLYLRGGTVIVGWHDPIQGKDDHKFAAWKMDLNRRAFNPAKQDQAPQRGPVKGIDRSLFSDITEPMRLAPESRAEAALLLSYFDGQGPRFREQNRVTWFYASMTGFSSTCIGGVKHPGVVANDIFFRLLSLENSGPIFGLSQDEGPYGVAFLGVRAARRAIKENPQDAQSYFLLGEAYLRLLNSTRERLWIQQIQIFEQWRIFQAIAAFQQAAKLRPDLPQIHGRLARLYRDSGKLDLALESMNLFLDAVRIKYPDQLRSIVAIEAQRDALQKECHTRKQLAERGANRRRLFDLANEANVRGLPKLALGKLLKSDISEFGTEGALLELELLLWSGKIQQVQRWLIPELEKSLGKLNYHQYGAIVKLVNGDYLQAVQEMQAVTQEIVKSPVEGRTIRDDIASAMAQAVLLGVNPIKLAAVRGQLTLFQSMAQFQAKIYQEADIQLLIGLAALEAGDMDLAKDAFKNAQKVSKHFIAEDCLKLISKAESR